MIYLNSKNRFFFYNCDREKIPDSLNDSTIKFYFCNEIKIYLRFLLIELTRPLLDL